MSLFGVLIKALELFSVFVYLDLYLVNSRGMHLFTPLIKKIDKEKMKKY